ncbi:ATP-binding protein [Streptomyces sp. NPDC051362]|uniref:ATP-binding protein n=1 Tax=Streptomyces sp. NPDC051362 TaxID=3365651 RepID=UPI0037B753DF
MTTYLADQERTCRRAPGTAPEHRSPGDARPGLDMSIERRPDPNTGGLSAADAAWPRRLRRIVRAGLHHWGRPDLIESAELLLTELATNALQHGSGPEIGVRIFLRAGRCVIEVSDGSPVRPVLRDSSPADERGRGLFLVQVMAAEWGVSQDGTTTWCTLPLTEGSDEMQPAAATAPVVREIPLDLPADRSAANLARIQARTLLTVANWRGDQHHAIDVLHNLVDNAVQHALTPEKAGQTFAVVLRLTEAHELLIDVTDPLPQFQNFDQAVAGEIGRGLWEVTRRGVALSWFVVGPGHDAKTVRAVLRPGQVDL